MKKLIAILALLAMPGIAWPATYYVDADAADDLGAGTSAATAWKTVAKVNASTFAPGDIVCFMPGDTWNEGIVAPSDGAEGNPITFTKCPGAGALPALRPAAGAVAAAFSANGKDYQAVEYLDLGAGTTANVTLVSAAAVGTTISNCTISGTGGSTILPGTSGITVSGCTITHAPDAVLYLLSPASTNVATITMTGNTITGVTSGTATRAMNWPCGGTLVFTGNTVTQASSPSSQFLNTTAVGKTSTQIISGNTFTISGVSMITVLYIGSGTHAVTISGNTFTTSVDSTSAVPIKVVGQIGTVISGNTITCTGARARGGIDVDPLAGVTSSGLQIVNNVVSMHNATSASYGIEVGTETTAATDSLLDGATITGNQVYGPAYWDRETDFATHGIFFGFAKGATIRKNYVNGAGYGIVVKGDGPLDWALAGDIAYNLVVHNHPHAGILLKGVANVEAFNNVVYCGYAMDGGASSAAIAAYVNISGAATGKLRNNILYVLDGSKLVHTDATSTLDTDFNLYWNSAGSGFDWTYGAAAIDGTIAAWRTETSGEDSSVTADPMFISTTDFRLLYASPARDAGVDLGLTSDYLGRFVFVGSAPDIGAYERPKDGEFGSGEWNDGDGWRNRNWR